MSAQPSPRDYLVITATGDDQVGLLFGVALHLVEDLLGVQQDALDCPLPLLVLLDVRLKPVNLIGPAEVFPLLGLQGSGGLL